MGSLPVGVSRMPHWMGACLTGWVHASLGGFRCLNCDLIGHPCVTDIKCVSKEFLFCSIIHSMMFHTVNLCHLLVLRSVVPAPIAQTLFYLCCGTSASKPVADWTI